MLESFLSLQLYSKETPTQVFPCEYFEIFKSTYIEEHLPTAAPLQPEVLVSTDPHLDTNLKGTAMDIKKVLISDCLRVSKVS